MGSFERQLETATEGIEEFLLESKDAGRIDKAAYEEARRAVVPNLREWLNNEDYARVSPNFQGAIVSAISAGRWADTRQNLERTWAETVGPNPDVTATANASAAAEVGSVRNPFTPAIDWALDLAIHALRRYPRRSAQSAGCPVHRQSAPIGYRSNTGPRSSGDGKIRRSDPAPGVPLHRIRDNARRGPP